MVTGAGEEQHESRSSHPHSQSLSDGRLNVGTHLPLMAKRYAYLSLIGEGTSAQVSLPPIGSLRSLSAGMPTVHDASGTGCTDA